MWGFVTASYRLIIMRWRSYDENAISLSLLLLCKRKEGSFEGFEIDIFPYSSACNSPRPLLKEFLCLHILETSIVKVGTPYECELMK